MPQFIFTGKAQLYNVTFFVVAKNEREAVAKAKAGDYEHYDTECAETWDTQIDPGTVKAND
jgi:hypothetical protein